MLLIKNMHLGSFLAIKVLKIQLIKDKEKCETFTNGKTKKGYEQIYFLKNIEEVALIWNLDLRYQQYWNVIEEITGIK